jgi:hypothetical protein
MAIFKVYTSRVVYTEQGVVAETRAEAESKVLETLYTDRFNLTSIRPLDVSLPKIMDIVEIQIP